MNTTDHWDDLKAAGQVPPPSPEVLEHARRQLPAANRRRRPLVAVVAAAAATAVVIGGVVAVRPGHDPISTTPAPTPALTIPSRGVAGSCAYAFSLELLKKRPFAFDGTVVSVEPRPPHGPLPVYAITFTVNEWFTSSKPTKQVVLVMYRSPGEKDLPSEFGPPYTIGSRLLVTGDLSDPKLPGTATLLVWGCGFSRPYTAADAATWRKAFGK